MQLSCTKYFAVLQIRQFTMALPLLYNKQIFNSKDSIIYCENYHKINIKQFDYN